MKPKFILFFAFSILCALIGPDKLYSLDITTHKKINSYIAEQMLGGFSLDSFLKEQAKILPNGITEILTDNKNVQQWMELGGEYEDDPPNSWPPYRRSRNHFHNPLLEWDQARYTGQYSFCTASDNFPLSISGHCPVSAVFWAQGPQFHDYITVQSIDLNPGGDWSWPKVRNSYFLALTSSAKSDRESNFADTFRGIGQLMHLVQDMSVPEHTRNSFHTFFGYEGWVKTKANSHLAEYYPTSSQFFAGTINSIASFFDTDQYIGNNPQVSLSNTVGLSEYTNANFFSPDTIFSANYPNPNKANTNAQIIEHMAEDGITVPGHYIFLNGQSYKLTAYSYYYNDIEQSGTGLEVAYNLDDAVYKDYASQLLPRAIGYSTGLLNYFFRGTLEISPPDQNVYAITDGSAIPQEFTKIKAKVRNTTSIKDQAGNIVGLEEIQGGTLQAVARYKKRTNYQPDLSTDPPTADSREPDFSYSVSEPVVISGLSATTSQEFTFDFTTGHHIPAGITDLYLHVVFKGTLGNEAVNAVAVGMKDLTEPAHHVFWNLSDQFSLESEVTSTMMYYHLYAEDKISTTATLRNMVDLMPPGHPNGFLNESGEPYVASYPMTFEIAYINEIPPATTPQPVARVENLPAGKYMRLIVIQDREQPRNVRFSFSNQIEPGVVGISDQQYSEVLNQAEPDGYFHYKPVYSFRYSSSGGGDPIRNHFSTGILRCYPSASCGGQSCCPYKESESVPADPRPSAAEILFNN